MLVRPLLLIMLVLILAGCGTRLSEAAADNPAAAVPQTLAQAQALWGANGASRYRVTVTRTCFCPPDVRQPIRVSVVEGEVIHLEGLEQPLHQPERLDTARLTVTGLFRFIEQAKKRNPHKLEVDYDASYGYPRRIDYDGHQMIADDEFRYELTDFRVSSPD